MLLSVGVALVLAAAWDLAQPALPEPVFRLDTDKGRVFWPEGEGGPYHCREDLEAAELVIVGDSRVDNAVYAEDFDAQGLGPTAALWGGGAELRHLLDEVRGLAARRLVVVLSPLSIYRAPGLQATLDMQPPDLDGADAREELVAWAQRFREQLLAAGRTQEEADASAAQWFAIQKRELDRRSLGTESIDRRLGDWANRVRERFVRTVTTSPWPESWFDRTDPGLNDESYLHGLRPETRAQRAQHLEELFEELAELQAAGWELAAARFPVSPSLFAVEEEALPNALLEERCEELGIPYLDASRADYRTGDGTHLTAGSGRRFSRDLARALAEATGWGGEAR